MYWILAILGLFAWLATNRHGWDVDVYRRAVHSFEQGHDPYQEEVAGTGDYSRNVSAEYGGGGSLYYVYSPVTLQMGAWIHNFRIFKALYWLLYAASVLVIVLVASSAVTSADTRYLAAVPPASLFFPGLLANGTIISGNVAITLYGLVFATAALGWRRRQWIPFYAVVIFCSLFKMPMLALLAIAVFSAPKQWIPAGAAAAMALSIFSLQSVLYPAMFRHQLLAVDHLFSFDRDVGCSPAGIFAGLLFDHGIPYFPLATLFFLAYALPVAAVLYRGSQRFFAGEFPLTEWMPVLLIGAVLLNPRIQEYDVLPITIPLALIAFRSAQRSSRANIAALILISLWLGANSYISGGTGTLRWKQIECVLLCAIFIAGVTGLRRRAHASTGDLPSPDQAATVQSSV